VSVSPYVVIVGLGCCAFVLGIIVATSVTVPKTTASEGSLERYSDDSIVIYNDINLHELGQLIADGYKVCGYSYYGHYGQTLEVLLRKPNATAEVC
jgi:hypothetical protein